jgi:hypothetical protein
MECKKERLFENTCVAVNVMTKKILSIKVTDAHVHDSKALPELVNDIVKSNKIIGKLFGDEGTYEGNDIFRYLVDNGTLPCFKVRKNSRVRGKKGAF